jgi:hypothetical protein
MVPGVGVPTGRYGAAAGQHRGRAETVHSLTGGAPTYLWGLGQNGMIFETVPEL